jgi:hypothetical protein
LSALFLCEQWLTIQPSAIAANHHTGSSQALAERLKIERVSIADTHNQSCLLCLVERGAVNGVDIKADHVAAPGRNRDCIFEPVLIGREMWSAWACGRFRDVFERALLM